MADDSLTVTYQRERAVRDKERLDRFLVTPLELPPEVQGPPSPAPKAESTTGEKLGKAATAGVTMTKDTLVEGATNFIQGLTNKGQLEGGGQQVLGVLQVLSALPAGVGAMVQEGLAQFTPGMEKAEMLPGGKAGETTPAGLVRSIFAAPGLLLDPKMKKAIEENPIPLAEALNEPMTFGEMMNLVAQFATPAALVKAKGLLKGKGGAAAEPVRTVTGEVVESGAPPRALPGQVVEGEVVRPAVGAGEPPRALPERTTTRPPPTPEEVARNFADAVEQYPPDFREIVREKYRTEMKEPSRATMEPAAPEAATPEGPLKSAAERAMETTPEPPGNLSSALDVALKRSEQVIKEEVAANPGEAGKVDPAMLARMGLGAVVGGTQGDTPEERIMNAFLGMGVGAVLSKKLATRLRDVYKESALADETGAFNTGAFSKKPRMSASEQEFQPNYQRLQSTVELDRLSKNLHRMVKEEILARKGAPKTNDATRAAAERMIASEEMTAASILKWDDQFVPSAEQGAAARMIAARSRAYLKELNDDFKTGKVKGDQLEDAMAVAAALSKNVRVAQTRQAQALQANRLKVGYETPSMYRPEDVVHLADNAGELRGKAGDISRMLDAIERPEQLRSAVELVSLFPRAFLEGMYFSYLSGKAVLRNAFGILAMQPLAIGTAAIAPYMPRWTAHARSTQGVLPGTATQMGIAWGEGIVDMFRLLRVWDKDTRAELGGLQDRIGGGKQVEWRAAHDLRSDGTVLEGTTAGQAIDYLGHAFRTPSNILGTTDAMGKIVNRHMWQRLEAFHQASREGVTGDAFWSRVDALNETPALLSDMSRERIMDFGERQTLTKDFEGRFLQMLQHGPSNPWLNAFYRFSLVPFFRTPVRGAEAGFLHTPVLNFTMAQFWRDMGSGGVMQQMAQAKVAFGGALMATFGYLESQGAITGDGPDDPALRRMWESLGWQRRSAWDPIGQKYRSYEGIAPLSDLLAAGSDMSAAFRRAPGDWMSAWWAGAVGMATAFDTKQYTRSFSEFLDVMRSQSDDTKVEKALELIRKRLAGLVPGAVRELEGAVDPERRSVRPSGAHHNTMARELDALKREIMSKVPGLSSLKDDEGGYLVPPDRDRIDGKPIVGETAPFFPFLSRSLKPHAVKEEIARLDGAGFSAHFPEWIGGGKPSADLGLGGREEANVAAGLLMTPQERDRLAVLWTQELKNGQGHTLPEALEAAIADPLYQQQSDVGPSGTRRDGGKAKWLQKVDAEFHDMASAALRSEYKPLDELLTQRQQERAVRKTPTADQGALRGVLQSIGR